MPPRAPAEAAVNIASFASPSRAGSTAITKAPAYVPKAAKQVKNVFLLTLPLRAIGKTETWNGSLLAETAEVTEMIIGEMLHFESCFHLLLDDEYEINGVVLDSKSLGLTHHLNQVKAYRLAEIYGHPEKLDEAIKAIKVYAETDKMSKDRIEKLLTERTASGMNWLYTDKFLERLSR